jgi:hypothetical protein
MLLETKAQIAKATLSLLTIVAALFLLGVLVLVICVGLQINPFRETTSSFLGAAFGGLIGVAVILVLLNVATSVSLIADAKIAELKIEPGRGSLKKWSIFLGVAVVGLVGLIFVGTYLSKERYLTTVHRQADEVLDTNKGLLEEISHLLASGAPEDYRRITRIRDFLQNQRSGLPEIIVIYSANFEGKMAFYSVGSYFPDVDGKLTYSPSYFPCTGNLDCDYLTRFFSGEKVSVLQKYTRRNDQFYIYVPFIGQESRFVLLFMRRNSYGKIGS